MYLLVLLLPLISSLSSGLLGFYLGCQGALLLACITLLACFLFSLLIFYEVVLGGSTVTISLWD